MKNRTKSFSESGAKLLPKEKSRTRLRYLFVLKLNTLQNLNILSLGSIRNEY
jgi:hypothetical protein